MAGRQATRPMTAKRFSASLVELGLTQTSFAALTDRNPRTIRDYVSGDLAVPRVVQLLLEAWLSLHRKGMTWAPAA